MFFALVANDRPAFDKLLAWTENNLASGDLSAHLPAWLWGQDDNKAWKVLDSNSAADADLWIAYNLLEAGRLWQSRRYQTLGTLLLQRIGREEVANIPGLGLVLLPGKMGFVAEDRWRLNPSYLPAAVAGPLCPIERAVASDAENQPTVIAGNGSARIFPRLGRVAIGQRLAARSRQTQYRQL
ncbi:Endoglucanase precursor [Serratia fonticola]|uniref:cellulase n=1 Tax=Serratia fonticola TaxID=47917 RepID=A0A4U9VTJ4_SERFO|nr:Endoglucanase precursor [Serratia fonticola]